MGSVDKLLNNMIDTLEILRKRVDEYKSALDRSERRNRELEEELKYYKNPNRFPQVKCIKRGV